MYEAKCVLENNAVLGEGPVWCPREGVLYWVDIGHFTLPGHADSGAPWESTISPSFHRFDPKSGTDEVFKAPQTISAFALREGGGFVGAFREGLARFDIPDMALDFIAPVEREVTGNRFNDGKCDRAGRFWAGTMDAGCREATGSLYRLDGDGTVTTMDTGIVVANGLGWSPDNSLMYYIDSPTQRIDLYDYDFDTGRIANKRTFVEIPPQDGMPDGMTVDSEGFVWCVLADGWRVTRYDPSGAVDTVVRLPVQAPTSCILGGEDLKTLYITTSRWDLTGQGMAEQPLAGGLFAIDVEVAGLVEPRYAG